MHFGLFYAVAYSTHRLTQICSLVVCGAFAGRVGMQFSYGALDVLFLRRGRLCRYVLLRSVLYCLQRLWIVNQRTRRTMQVAHRPLLPLPQVLSYVVPERQCRLEVGRVGDKLKAVSGARR